MPRRKATAAVGGGGFCLYCFVLRKKKLFSLQLTLCPCKKFLQGLFFTPTFANIYTPSCGSARTLLPAR